MRTVKISDITVDERARKNIGDLDSLRRSIEQIGVLQPIGVTKDLVLVFGGRRLQASIDAGLEEIPARIFDIDAEDPVAALKMEREENLHRKDLTPVELTHLAMRIEEGLGNRRGQRTDILAQDFAEVPKGESRDIAAQAVNMNRETYRQAKAVVKSDDRDLIGRMDDGDLSIHAAYRELQTKLKQSEDRNRKLQESLEEELSKPPVVETRTVQQTPPDVAAKLGALTTELNELKRQNSTGELTRKKAKLEEEIAALMLSLHDAKNAQNRSMQQAKLLNTVAGPIRQLEKHREDIVQELKSALPPDERTRRTLLLKVDFLRDLANAIADYVCIGEEDIMDVTG